MSKKFQHLKVPSNLLAGKKVLDIGCGRKKLSGAVGLDMMKLPEVDIIADLNQKLPIEDETFEAVHADQVLEHVDNLIGLVYEVYRILKAGGIFLIHVPYFRSSWAHIDPTHVRSFTINSMNYFVKGTFEYENYRFQEEAFSHQDIFLDVHRDSTLCRHFFSVWALKNPVSFENTFLSSLYPFQQVSYLLTK